MTHNAQSMFLGAVRQFRRGAIDLDLMGLTTAILYPFFPQDLNDIYLVFALTKARSQRALKITVGDKSQPRRWANLSYKLCIPDDPTPVSGEPVVVQLPSMLATQDCDTEICADGFLPLAGAHCQILVLKSPSLQVFEPTTIGVTLEVDDVVTDCGMIQCVFEQPSPLTDAEKELLRGCAGGAGLTVVCNECHEQVRFVYQLAGAAVPPSDVPTIPVLTAPDSWSCTCGTTTIPLRYLKRGMHVLLRHTRRGLPGAGVSSVPPFRPTPIERVATRFNELIRSSPNEEAVHRFLDENGVMWSFLGVFRIKSKPAILTKYRADFAILSRRNILYLIEIEKPTTRLCKKNGGLHSELQAALDQISSWRATIQNDRRAVLSEMGFAQDLTSQIRFLVVAGLASGTNKEHLRRARDNMPDDTDLMTFDELLAHTISNDVYAPSGLKAKERSSATEAEAPEDTKNRHTH